MSVGQILAAIWFILVGVVWLNWIQIDFRILGLIAFIVGLVWLIENMRPLISRR